MSHQMTFQFFQQQYGEAFYGFINSELGLAMLRTLEFNDIANRLGNVEPEVQSKNAKLFLGQVTGWRDAIYALRNKMILLPDTSPKELEANYEKDEELPVPIQKGVGVNQEQREPTPIATTSKPRKRKK